MSAGNSLAAFAAYVQTARQRLIQAGWQLGEEKKLPYGLQLTVRQGNEMANLSLYYGKKGCSTVVGGKAGALKHSLEQSLGLEQPDAGSFKESESKTERAKDDRTVDIPVAPYGFENLTGYEQGWIGTDESGKGDVFGPLVVAAVAVSPPIVRELEKIGVKDCKQLADAKTKALAQAIRQICPGRFQELVLVPERYNRLYGEMKREGKNLNHLLAWAHARVLEDLLGAVPCRFAITDQFADVRFVESRLMGRGRALTLIQKPYAEKNIAVAAASVLARDCFLREMQQLNEKFGLVFPKGAGTQVNEALRQFVSRYDKQRLEEVGKLHFRTFEGVLG